MRDDWKKEGASVDYSTVKGKLVLELVSKRGIEPEAAKAILDSFVTDKSRNIPLKVMNDVLSKKGVSDDDLGFTKLMIQLNRFICDNEPSLQYRTSVVERDEFLVVDYDLVVSM
jgi:hypothetical protein